MDRTDRATQIFCVLIGHDMNLKTDGSAIRMAIDLAYDIEEAVLAEEQRRAREEAGNIALYGRRKK